MDQEAVILHFLRTESARKKAARSKEKFVKALAKKLKCSPEKAVDTIGRVYKSNPLARDLLKEIKTIWDKRESIAKKRKELAYVLMINELVQTVNAGKKVSLVKMREKVASQLRLGKSTIRKMLREYSQSDKRFAELMILLEKIKQEHITKEKQKCKR
jgi:ABC-type enterochelin transport system substrate-binding protein